MKEHRLDRLSSALLPRERALLVLDEWRTGKAPNPDLRWSMPPEHVFQFNRLLGLLNGVNIRLFPFLLVVLLEADKLALRVGWLATITLWHMQADNARGFVEHGANGNGPPAWVASAFEHAPQRPVVYISEEFQELVANAPARPATRLDELVVVHKDALRDGLVDQWRNLRASEIVVAETEAVLGEDPALPDVHELLDRARRQLTELRDEAATYIGPLELPEPNEELLKKVRALVVEL